MLWQRKLFSHICVQFNQVLQSIFATPNVRLIPLLSASALGGYDFLHNVCARHGHLVSKIPRPAWLVLTMEDMVLMPLEISVRVLV